MIIEDVEVDKSLKNEFYFKNLNFKMDNFPQKSSKFQIISFLNFYESCFYLNRLKIQ